MREMSISETRKNLPQVISEILASGEEVMITRNGRPVAKLVGHLSDEGDTQRYPLRGLQFQVEGEFDAPLPDMWEALQE